MLKFIIGLLVLLAICIVAGFIRRVSGGCFLPPPQDIEGEPEPQSLRELAQRLQRVKANN